MKITAFFTQDGVPKTGLTPTCTIYRNSDGVVIVDSASMTEVGGGFYVYNFTTGTNSTDYSVKCDGGASLSSYERYTYEGFYFDPTPEDSSDGGTIG